MKFGQILKELRKKSGETQVAVARAVGLSERQYQCLEAGTHLPSLENFMKLADHFGVSMDYLTGRGEQP